MNRTLLLGIAVVLSAAHIGTNTSHGQAAAPAPPPAPKWEKSAALGLTLTEGNSDTLLVTANLRAARKSGPHEISLGADGTYGENNDERNNQTLSGFGQYNRLFT